MGKPLEELAVLPFDVRYTLRYGNAELSIDEIRQLAKPQFYGLAPYLAIKALDRTPSTQKDLIEGLVRHFSSGNGYNGLNDVLEQYLNETGIKVKGGKVAQINRIGPLLVEEKFQELAEESYKNGSTPVLLSYAALIGLRPFVERHLGAGAEIMPDSRLFVIIPKFLGKEFVGYTIRRNQEGVRVEHLSDLKDLTLSDVTLIDDTINSGSTIKKVLDYWKDHNLFPRTVTIRYIDMVNVNKFLTNLSYYITNRLVSLPKGLEKDL